MNLQEYVSRLQPKRMLYLPNGVDFGHFGETVGPLPPEYMRIPKPIAIYVGSIEAWFDFDLLNRAAAELSHVSFVLIGPEEMALRKLKKLPNIHVLGPRPYQDIPSYLQHATVGLIPFDRANHATLIDNVNPLKLYEYMASGLPVVAVEWEELRRIGSPAFLTKTIPEFISRIQQLTSGESDCELFRSYARNHSYGTRFHELLLNLEAVNATE